MCEPTFEEWFFSFAAELERLTGQQVNFDRAYDTYLPALEDGVCGGVCARMAAGADADAFAVEARA
ncbi:hypothetical protein CN233_28935 [Sinorhizobium meliloti]|uniref:hypothetical protein n=1 Tax=Rhizobium meliloti TaxID=382 RepID=UPI0001E4D383|nr:hypothetical protein [Sinorhizobium meliloti]AEG58278.1 hypothetical protein Sinme_6957 [Sinorhizobium meliloti AK83]MDE4589221.1 hypothetical protein [Sinorhizobium meliloti]RVG23694.1 hypothetical protein CN233_28935 [Sinorhizobium meliloti]WQP15796.1 hypothetical protein U8C30_34120 [Sinorhizobium meliloti]WQP29286.1 hypothetical protein U8C43_34075 [Sinorhizobium meliloti]